MRERRCPSGSRSLGLGSSAHWFPGGPQGRGVRDPHPGVASTTPAVGLDPKTVDPMSSRTSRPDRLPRSLGELQAGSQRSRRVAAELRAPWPRADAILSAADGGTPLTRYVQARVPVRHPPRVRTDARIARPGACVRGAPAGGCRDLTCENVAMSSVGSQHVEEAVAEMLAVLTPQEELDWQARAGSLEWCCWKTAAHVAHDLTSYAGQVAARATAGYLPFDLVIVPEAAPRDVLGVVSACGRLLSNTVASAGAGPVAWHWGMSDAAGFAQTLPDAVQRASASRLHASGRTTARELRKKSSTSCSYSYAGGVPTTRSSRRAPANASTVARVVKPWSKPVPTKAWVSTARP